MDSLSLGQAVAGGALLFFVPGFVVAKAVFPERRLRGPGAVRWGIELVALALVVSVVLTVTVGYLLLVAAPSGFNAGWSDPLLESVLAAVALVAFLAGWWEGAYARVAPLARPHPESPGSTGAWELTERLDALQRERQRLERQIRSLQAPESTEGDTLRSRLHEVTEEERTLRERREGEYER